MPSPADKHPRLLLAAILALALGLRVAYVLALRASPFFAAPEMDPLYHLEWARALVAGAGFPPGEAPGAYFRAPLYPWFLAGLLKLFGEDLLLVRLVQCLLGSASTALTFLIGRRAYGAGAGLLAALLVATNPVLVYFDGELLIPTLLVPLILLALWLSLRLEADGARPRAHLLAGLAWGLAAIARPNVLLLMPVLFAWLLLRRGSELRTRLLRAALLTAGVSLPILPLTVRNAVVGGEAVLISSQAGVNLWIGNNPESDGSTAIVPGTRPDWWGGYRDAIALAQAAEGRELKGSEVSAHYSAKARAFLFGRPSESVPLLLHKLRLFWLDRELGNNQDVRFFSRRYAPWMAWLPPSFGLLAPLGLIGLVLALRRPGHALALWTFVPVYMASVVLFFVCARFRAPVVPALALLSAHALLWGAARARERDWRRLLPAAGAAVALGALVQLPPAGLDASDAAGLWQLGQRELQDAERHAREGRGADARAGLLRATELLQGALEENPRFWFARKDLGRTLALLGRDEEAQRQLEAVLAQRPGELAILSALNDLFYAAGRGVDAERVARAAIAAHPEAPAGYANLARALMQQGRAPEALAPLRDGLARDPGDFACNFILGSLLLQSGEAAEAARCFERAVQSAPDAPWRARAAGELERARDLRQG